MDYRMAVVRRQIAERHADAEQERLAKSLRGGRPSGVRWNPFRILKPRRTEPARA